MKTREPVRLLGQHSRQWLDRRPLSPLSYPLLHRVCNTTMHAPAPIPPLPRMPFERPQHDTPPSLALLPFSKVLRSYAITAVSSSPHLLDVSARFLRSLLNSRSAFTNVEKNPLLRFVLKHTFYAQFCAGETKPEVKRCLQGLASIGYSGTILEYASEVLEDAPDSAAAREEVSASNVAQWRQGLLDTVDMANPGDFVAFKWSGMGPEALRLLKANQPPAPRMAQAMTDLCDAAAAKGVLLLPAAEPQNANAAVDEWNMQLSRRYNRGPTALLYNTFQSYLKSTPANLAAHLADAQKYNYTMGAKLVRGAYLATEPRHLIWDTKEETDQTFDALMESLLQREYNDALRSASPIPDAFPSVDVVIATHNNASVKKAMTLRDAQARQGQTLVKLSYAQLQGMADEVSCELIQASHKAQVAKQQNQMVDVPHAFKYVTWGTMSECLHYLLRRADENKDAMSRTSETCRAMKREISRRLKLVSS